MQTLRNEEEESSYEIFNRILALGLLRAQTEFNLETL